MTIIKIQDINGYHLIQSQSHRTENWMGDEWIEVPENLISKLNSGCCKLVIDNNLLVDLIPIEIPINLDEYKQDKISDLSSICNQSITNGFDIELSSISGHCSLTTEDQINISTAYNAILQGAETYPYHLDEQLCQMFSANDIIKITQTATAHKLYHTTYFNHLKVWVERCKTKEEIDAIIYGSELPEDLTNSMESIINTVNKS